MNQNHSASTLNQALKSIGVTPKTHGIVLEFAFTPIDRSKPARQARRNEYNGLKALPFYSAEQAKRLETLKIEVVADNHAAFEEAQAARAAPDVPRGTLPKA